MLGPIRWRSVIAPGLASLIIAVFLLVPSSSAYNTSPWLGPSPLKFQREAFASPPASWNGNIDCYPESESFCAVSTAYGSASDQSTIRLVNSSGYLPVFSNIDGRQHFIPIPNSDSFITYTAEPVYGLYLYFNYNLSSSIRLVDGGYQIIRQPAGRLQDKSGHLWQPTMVRSVFPKTDAGW